MTSNRKSSKSLSGSRRTAAFAAGGALAVLFISGAAVAVTDTNFTYTTAKTGYYGIDAGAMAPAEGVLTYTNTPEMGLMTSGGLGCFTTAVNLPQGATIKGLAIYYSSTDEEDVTIQLFRQQFSDGTISNIASKAFTDFGAVRKAGTAPITAANAVVNNQNYSYVFRACVDPGGGFYSARINYTYTNAGD